MQWLGRATDDRVVAVLNSTGAAWKRWQFPLPHFASVSRKLLVPSICLGGLWLSDGWYVGLSCVCLRACADGLWTVCMCAFCAGGSIKLYILHILHNIILHLLRLFYLSLLL